MNTQETAGVLAVLSANWPGVEITSAQAALWAEQLHPTLVEDALAAVKLIVRTDQWFPTLARMIETSQAMARARAQRDEHRAITETRDTPRTDPVAAKASIARLREQLTKIGKPVP